MTRHSLLLAIAMRGWLALAILLGSLGWSGQATAQASAAPYQSATRYDPIGQVVGTIAPDPDGSGPLGHAAVRNSYDAAGRLVRVETGELANWQSEAVAPANWAGFTVLQTVDTAYDELSRRIRVTATGSTGTVIAVTQYSYDAAGRLQCTALRMNPAAYGTLPASACTLGPEGTSGPDRITRQFHDAAGQVIQTRSGVGTSVEAADASFAYNLNGQMTVMVDANGNRAEFRYDGHGRRDRWALPSATRPAAFNDATAASALSTSGAVNPADYEESTYDNNGNRLSLRRRDGSTLTYTYDALNRTTVRVVPERAGLAVIHTRDVHYGYDLRSLQTIARFDSLTGQGISNSYDGFGRVLSTSTSMGGTTRTLTYTRDRNGNRTQLTWMDGAVTSYAYDGLDRLGKLFEGPLGAAPQIARYGYNNRVLLASRTARTGAEEARTYDTAGRLLSLTLNPAATTFDVQWTFGRNPASQIIESTRDNASYAFGSIVNVDRTYTANGLNQYTAAGSAAFTYDANGNLTGDGVSTYTYDVENRLVERAGAATASLLYDPLGRLFEVVGSSTTRFLYDGDELVAEYDGAGTLLRRYVHGTAIDDPVVWYEGSGFNSPRWLHADALGSIVGITDASGAVIAVNAYDEFGIPNGANGIGTPNLGRFQYTGQIWLPEIGAYYYKARIYSPTLGRFLQVDPIGYEDQVNLYAYVHNDPVNATDPTGMDQDTPEQLLDRLLGYAVEAVQEDPGIMIDAVAILADVVTGPSGEGALVVTARRGLSEADEVADAAVIYLRINPRTGAEYVGRSRNMDTFARRQRDHNRTGGVQYRYRVLERVPQNRARQAEQRHITERGGPRTRSNPNARLENRRNEIRQPRVQRQTTRPPRRLPRPPTPRRPRDRR